MSGVFLYDGDCGFFTSSARWLERRTNNAATVLAFQHADLAALGLSAEDSSEAVQWVDDGHRVVGPEALAAFLLRSRPPWRTAGRVLAAPVARQVSWPVYRWLSRHRGRLPGGTPASELPRLPPPIGGVRRRRPGDLGACARLLRVVFSEGQYPVYWPAAPRAWLDDDDVVAAWIVERQREILGHVAISRVGPHGVSALRWREVTGHPTSELAVVSRLFIRPRVRGQGIGSALLDVAVSEIRTRGLIPVLEVVSASEDAIKLFEGRGWRLVAIYPWGKNVDRLQLLYYTLPPEPHG